jgi:hypothetical protein
MSKHLAKDYLAIALWGQMMQSFGYYIDAQQESAAEDGAPVDALFKRDGKWICVSDLDAKHSFRAAYDEALERKGAR